MGETALRLRPPKREPWALSYVLGDKNIPGRRLGLGKDLSLSWDCNMGCWLSLLSVEAECESLFFSRSLDFRVGFMLARDKPHLFSSHGCCMACHEQLCRSALPALPSSAGWQVG